MIEQYVNAEELKRLLSSLLVFLGALAIAALFASIVVPGLRNANKPPAAMPVNPAVGETGWLDPAEYPPQRGREIPAVDARTLIDYSPALVERGSELFRQDCVQCHGELGRGDGPAAATLNPRPRNFTSPDGWKNGHDLPSIFKTLAEGVKGSSMASFDYLSKADRMALAHYVRALGTFSHGTGAQEAVEALTKELSAAGERTPNRIPVSVAMRRLEQEFEASPPLSVDPADHSAGAEVLRRAVVDPARAAQSLAGLQGWRTAPKELADGVLNGAPANGFSVSAATLSPAEWQALHRELLTREGQK
jgi:mono/diheme cytochrome c family protein